MKIVTAADSSHFKSLIQFLKSAFKFESDSNIIFYDLGLVKSEKKKIKANFPKLIYKNFNYSKYPKFFNIKINAGEFGWKPNIIWEEVKNQKECVCWMDSGNLINKKLTKIRTHLNKSGFFVIKTNFNSKVGILTDNKMIEYLSLPIDYCFDQATQSAACVAFNPLNQKAYNLSRKWAYYAKIKKCIAPKGSNFSNHRQDQSLLEILVYLYGFRKIKKKNYYLKLIKETFGKIIKRNPTLIRIKNIFVKIKIILKKHYFGFSIHNDID